MLCSDFDEWGALAAVVKIRHYRGRLLQLSADRYPKHAERRAEAGRCRWCAAPTRSKYTKWHGSCVQAHAASLGLTYWRGRPLIPLGVCASCRVAHGDEIDHRDAKGVAERAQDMRRLFNACTVANLQWLCKACHKAKTGRDRAEMAQLDRKWRSKLL